MIERQNDTEGDVVLLLTTFSDGATARQIGTQMVESQLAACVNVLPRIESIFRWQGSMQIDEEAMVMVKTTRTKLLMLEAWLQTHHPYEVPEILVFSPELGSTRYLQWIRESVGETDETSVDNASRGA